MMDSFEQNGEFADAQDSQDMDTGNSQSSAAATRANADIILVPNEDGVVILPDGASLENLTSAGRDLVIVLDDGTRILIPEGAIIVPQIVVDGVTVPAANLAALLTGNEPQPAAGDPQSSGGNFEVDPGNIQAAYDIGDLLPYTQLQFPEPEEREIIPYLVDQDPEIVIETPDNPAGVINAIATVNESGLPARTIDGIGESEGTQDETNLETSTGTIVFNSPDGVASVAINGVAITEIGQTFVGDKGILTITSIDLDGGEIGFTFTLTDNLVGETVDGSFSMTVTDTDGDSATATLQINVVDDAPIARDDSNDVPGGSHDTIFGNVTDNDESGADSYPDTGAVTGFANSGGSAEPGDTLVGTYGELTLNADGSYSYDRFVNTPGGVSEQFTYTITDTDGSTSTATLTINIGDAPNVITNVPEGEDATVVEEGQLPPTTDTRDDEPEGSNFDGDDETATGTITFTSPDGVDTITIGGTVIDPNNLPQVVVSDDTGTLTVTGYTYDPETGVGTITYDYELTDNTGDTDGTTVTFPIVITDLDGDQAEDDLEITIIDDVPEAVDDAASQPAENAPISIDVLANDTVGADGVDLATGVEAVDGSLSGTGSLAYNGDGSFTYTPSAGETGTVTFQYAITDGDGDVSTATVTLTLTPDSTPEISVEGDNDVEEAALGARDGEPEGSNAASDGEIANGVISITTGSDTIASLVINGVNVTSGGQVATDSGVLTITESNGAYSYSFELLDNTLSDPDSESFSLTVTDSDGDTASTTLVIAIIDDEPSAEDDSNAIAAGEYGPVGGNVLSNDTVGADDASVTSFTGSGGSGAAGETVQGAYGTLTLGADGTYSYTRDPGTPGDVEDSFDYVITDGDGDTATATLVISIADSPVTLNLPVDARDRNAVDEAGLPAGSAAATDAEFTSGSFTYTAPDGPAVITIGGTAVTTVGQTFTGSYGTLTVTSIVEGEIGYTYELTTNTDGDDTLESFAVTVTDQDGDTTSGDLEIDIVDDVPTARPDTDSVTEDGPLSASGNVISDAEANGDDGEDTQGADGAEVSAFSFGTDPGTLGEPLAGLYGTLTLDADGEYIYELDNTNPLVQGLDSNDILTEVFNYTLTDGDGDARSTTLTITINGADDIVTINGLDLQTPEEVVDEDDLPEGSSPDANALVQDGSFTVDSPDGLSVLTVGGTAVWGNGETYPVSITGDFGMARITDVTVTTDANGDVVSATVFYEYELSGNTLEHDAAGEDDVTDSFEVVATDTDGSQDTASLDIQVIDDIPVAEDDTNSVVEGLGNSASGNVYDGAGVGDNPDELGADTDGTSGVEVTGVRTGEEGDAGALTVVGGAVTVSGAYGDLTINPDGSYTYTLTTASIPTNVTSETFTYQITDADGDTDLAELVITLNQDPNAPDITGDALTVYEDGLADGVQHGANSETAAGSFDVDTNGEDVTFTLTADNSNTLTDPAIGDTLTTTKGVMEITNIVDNGDGTFTYEYTYTLSEPLTHMGQGEVNPLSDTITMSVTDATGDSDATPGSIVISIVDDIPVAEDNTNTVSEGASTNGNILTDDDGFGVDVAGADGLAGILGVTSDDSGDSDATGPFTVTSSLGTLTVQANGDYTYDSFANSTNANTTDTFTYQIIDADGDISEAQLVITINNVAGNVSDNDALVFEAGLDGIGSDAGSNSEIDANGQITVTGASGTLTYSLTSSATGSYGTLTLDPVTGEYTYTLTTPVYGDTLSPDQGGDNDDNTINATVVTGFETFTYQVVDQDNNVIGTGAIQVSIVDDVPTATDQTLITVAEDAADIGGNVMTDGVADTEGADGATVTSITVGTETVAVPQDGNVATLTNANGTYTIDMDGNWTFNPTDSLDQTGGPIVADFTYTLTDGDGDLDTATQPIRIEDGQAPGNPDGLDLALDDQNLADGSTPGGDDFDMGTINFVPGSDPFATIVFGDVSNLGGDLTWDRTGDFEIVGSDGNGPVVTLTLVVNGNDATVTATLNDNYLGHDFAGDDLDDLGFVNVVATDTDGDQAFGRVDVSVSDDVPTAEDDTNSVVEGLGNSASGNVYDGAGVGDNPDELGADTDGTSGVEVTGVRTGEEGDAGALTVVGGAVTVSGAYGDLTINPDGSYTYTLTTASIPTNVTSETFTYQITDADGDTDLAELVITLNQDPNAPDITGDALTVYEDGLADGVQHGANSETAAGSFDVDTNGEDVTFTLTADNSNTLTDPAIGDTLTTTKGVMEITNIVDNGDGTFTYEYTYTLSEPLTHMGQGEVNPLSDTITMSVTDATGDSDATPGSIVISIVDDIPVAEDDTNSVVEGLGNSASGNVYDGAGVGDNPDELGADTDGTSGVEVTGVRTGEEGDAGALTVVGGAVTVSGAYGDLTINPDGSYTYTLTTASIPTNVTSETFTYQITDADGDTDLAELVITLNQDPNVPNLIGDARQVFEDGLVDGVQHGADSETVAGAFSIQTNGEDVTFTLTADNSNTLTDPAIGDTLTTSKGVIEITDIIDNGAGVFSYQYTYTLSAALTHTGQGEVNPILDTITTTITDATGDSDPTPGSIVISIVDDVPLAIDPVDILTGFTNTPGAATRDLDVDGEVVNNIGADQPGEIVFNHSNGDDSGLDYQGSNVLIYVSSDGTTIEGRAGAAADGTGGTLVFTVELDQGSAEYTFTLIEPVDNGSGTTFSDLSGGEAGNPPFKIIDSATSGNIELLFTPWNAGSVNSDTDDVGVDGQFINIQNPDAGLNIHFGQFSGVDQSGGPAPEGYTIDSLSNVNGFRFTLDQVSSGTTADIRIATWDADTDGGTFQTAPAYTNADSLDEVTRVDIYDAADNLVGSFDRADGNVSNFNNTGLDIVWENDTVLIQDVNAQFSIVTFTDDGYNNILITNAGTSGGTDGKFSLTDLRITETEEGNPVSTSFDLKVIDEDLDEVIVADAIEVVIDPVGSASATTTTSSARTMETTMIAAAASAFMMGDTGGTDAFSPDSPGDGSTTTYSFMEMDGALKLSGVESGFTQEFVQEADFDLASAQMAPFEANILEGGSAIGDSTPVFGFDAPEMGIDYSAFDAPEVGAFASNGAFDGLDMAAGDATASMEALLLMEAPLPEGAIAELDAKAAIGEAISDLTAEASVDALVTHFAGDSGAANDGWHSIAPTEGLLDTMVQPGLAQSLANGLTVDQLDDAALAGTAA